ncbi:MAG: hypothetical protein FJ102_00205 [Deltaproteobacteria bacterium]|nr:hypothetical protein [Deltaproteobacteria bacterium]
MIALLTLFACGQPAHLQYDFGRSFNEATATQATLDRASAADDAYALAGKDALATREQVRKAATDTEKGTPTVTATVAQ